MTALDRAGRLDAFGTTIFAEMSALAVSTGSINLGQGFPDTDGPVQVLQAAQRAIAEGRGNQYPPGPGIPELRQAVADHQRARYGMDLDPAAEVLVTVGATEALAAAVLGLTEPGDEVVTFEPYYDSYAACIALGGARRRVVTLRPDGGRWTFDPDELRAAVTDRTRLLLVNTPHNPTGTVFTREELTVLAELARRAGPGGGHRRGVRAPGDGRRAPAAGHPARHGRAHHHHLQRRQDLQRDRLEGRLGLRAGRRCWPGCGPSSSS